MSLLSLKAQLQALVAELYERIQNYTGQYLQLWVFHWNPRHVCRPVQRGLKIPH